MIIVFTTTERAIGAGRTPLGADFLTGTTEVGLMTRVIGVDFKTDTFEAYASENKRLDASLESSVFPHQQLPIQKHIQQIHISSPI